MSDLFRSLLDDQANKTRKEIKSEIISQVGLEEYNKSMQEIDAIVKETAYKMGVPPLTIINFLAKRIRATFLTPTAMPEEAVMEYCLLACWKLDHAEPNPNMQ